MVEIKQKGIFMVKVTKQERGIHWHTSSVAIIHILYVLKSASHYMLSDWSIGVFRREYVNTFVTVYWFACIFEKYFFIKPTEDFCLHGLIQALGGWEDSQKLSKPKCLEFPQTPKCLDEAMWTPKKVLYCLTESV